MFIVLSTFDGGSNLELIISYGLLRTNTTTLIGKTGISGLAVVGAGREKSTFFGVSHNNICITYNMYNTYSARASVHEKCMIYLCVIHTLLLSRSETLE